MVKKLVQFSTIEAIFHSLLDGNFLYDQISKYGNFGIGTLNSLDGEVIIINGNGYTVRSDGKAYDILNNDKIPYAIITEFSSDILLNIDDWISYRGFINAIDTKIPTNNIFYAIKIEGSFNHINLRSIDKQNKPFKPFLEIYKQSKHFNYSNIDGTLVGFRCPPFVQGLNISGYHFHFISNDRRVGGHLYDFESGKGQIDISVIHDFQLILDNNESFYKTDFLLNKNEEFIQVHKNEFIDL
jgi:acetolactate decarboxylase